MKLESLGQKLNIKMKTLVVIPCYNEQKHIGKVATQCRKYVDGVVVADDCSTDNTIDEADRAGAGYVQERNVKRGAGRNTKMGLNYAIELSGQQFITLDGDGQHDPDDIPRLLKGLETADFVVGSRFIDGKVNIKIYRYFGIKVITWLYNIGSKIKLTDAQCCFRAFSKYALEKMPITENGFEFSVETLVKARASGLRIKEVPVKCIYHKDFGQNSTLNPIRHGLGVAFAVIKWRLKLELKPKINDALYSIFRAFTRPLIGKGLGRFKLAADLYRSFARRLIPDKDKTVSVNGCKMRLRIEKGKDIDGIAQSLLFKGTFEPLTTQIFKDYIKRGMTVVDVGANIGYYTLLSSKLVGSKGVVWAFEPELRNFQDLVQNIKLNGGDYLSILPVNVAVSDVNGTRSLYVSKTESGEHSLIKGRTNKPIEQIVECVKLDNYLAGMPVDFIKIDTEGNEYGVLMGMRDLVKRSPNLKVVLEFWPDGLELAGHNSAELWDLLVHMGLWPTKIINEQGSEIVKASYEKAIELCNKHKFSVNLFCERC